MVKIRLARAGERNRPYYRVIAIDSRKKRDGAYIELLGQYDPTPAKSKSSLPPFNLKKDRIMYWLKNGAQPCDTVLNYLKSIGMWKEFVESKPAKKAKKSKRKLSAAKREKIKDIKKNGKKKKIKKPVVVAKPEEKAVEKVEEAVKVEEAAFVQEVGQELEKAPEVGDAIVDDKGAVPADLPPVIEGAQEQTETPAEASTTPESNSSEENK